MIGSRTKVAAVKAALEAAGIAREILDGVHSPIGLPIGAQTPAEIAVSIAAELVQERARRGPAAAPRRRGSRACCVPSPPSWCRSGPAGGRRPRPGGGEPGVLCTITAKRGSAPGAWVPGCWCGPTARCWAPSAAARWSTWPSRRQRLCGRMGAARCGDTMI